VREKVLRQLHGQIGAIDCTDESEKQPGGPAIQYVVADADGWKGDKSFKGQQVHRRTEIIDQVREEVLHRYVH
jgi:hypothetical protein